jgi:hypothetical protein
MPHEFHRFQYPEVAYVFEQSRLYPTKRALMLVSRAWAALAAEFMYESLVIGHFGVGRPELVFATLEGSTGLVLKKWVKRVDIFWCSSERLARIGLPNLRAQNLFYDMRMEPFSNLLSEQPLHLVEPRGSTILDRLPSQGGAFGSLRCLTFWMVNSLPNPLHLPSTLRRLTIIASTTDTLRLQIISSTHDSVALPNLTHLTLHHRNQAPDRFVWSMEIINHIGPQLRHLSVTDDNRALVWAGADLCTIFSVCTQLTELLLPSFLGTWKAHPGDYGHSILQTLGIPFTPSTSERDFKLFFGIFSRREAFPKLGTIRLLSWEGNTADKPWLEPYTIHRIRLEDCWGRPLLPASVLDDQNQYLLSGCMDAVPL